MDVTWISSIRFARHDGWRRLDENHWVKPFLHVGCAMWTHRAWHGTSIPHDTPRREELAAYARVVNAVEGNTTFYATPAFDTARHWAASVPADFRFMFKLPRTITHDRKLRDVTDELVQFLTAMEPCHHLMEPISIQLPAAFAPADLPSLDAFLSAASTEHRWAVEVRHRDFFDDVDCARRLNDLLFGHGADRVILDSRAVFAGPSSTEAEIEAFANKPRLPVVAVATNDRPVVRFIGQTAAAPNPHFWAPWVDTVVRWLNDGRRPLVFIHTPDNVIAPALCRQFHGEVAARLRALDPLPEAPPAAPPTLFD